MKIAIPTTVGRLTIHFGHCEEFMLIDVDEKSKTIIKEKNVKAPPHQPGLLPPWLKEQGVDLVIAGGMGQRARSLFIEQGIDVVVGAPAEVPKKIVIDYLEGKLITGENVCDH